LSLRGAAKGDPQVEAGGALTGGSCISYRGCRLSASFASAAAAEVERVLLRLLTRLGVDHDLAYRYPAIVAGVGAFVLVVVVLTRSGWVRWWCARLSGVHWGPFPLVRASGCATTAGAISFSNNRIILPLP